MVGEWLPSSKIQDSPAFKWARGVCRGLGKIQTHKPSSGPGLANPQPGFCSSQGFRGWGGGRPGSRAVLMGLLPPVTPMMELKPNAGSDRAWVWNTHADFADECPKQELLAIRFLNAESKQARMCTERGALRGGLRSQGCAPPAPQAAVSFRWHRRERHPVAESGTPSPAVWCRGGLASLCGACSSSAWQDGLPRWEWGVCGTLRDRVLLAAQGSLGRRLSLCRRTEIQDKV